MSESLSILVRLAQPILPNAILLNMTMGERRVEDNRFVDTLCRNTNVQAAINRFDLQRPIQPGIPRPRLTPSTNGINGSPESTISNDFPRIKTYIPAGNNVSSGICIYHK